jgi:hypothetical protein
VSVSVLHCGQAAVAVEADATLLDELSATCRPWITAIPVRARPPDLWTVHVTAAASGKQVASRTGAAVLIRPAHRLLDMEASAAAQDARPLVRLLRALLRRQLAADGEVFLNAAVLTLGSCGIALLGGTGAGKTTTLVAALHRHHGALVANDDASLRTDGGRVTARGYPRAIEVRRDVLPHLAGAADRLTDAAESDSPGRALYVTPHRLATALGGRLAGKAELSALVLLARGTGRPELHRLAPERAIGAVAAHLAVADPYETWLHPHLPAPAPNPAQAHRLARAVPVWRLTQPLTAMETSADLLAELSASSGGPR